MRFIRAVSPDTRVAGPLNQIVRFAGNRCPEPVAGRSDYLNRYNSPWNLKRRASLLFDWHVASWHLRVIFGNDRNWPVWDRRCSTPLLPVVLAKKADIRGLR